MWSGSLNLALWRPPHRAGGSLGPGKSREAAFLLPVHYIILPTILQTRNIGPMRPAHTWLLHSNLSGDRHSLRSPRAWVGGRSGDLPRAFALGEPGSGVRSHTCPCPGFDASPAFRYNYRAVWQSYMLVMIVGHAVDLPLYIRLLKEERAFGDKWRDAQRPEAQHGRQGPCLQDEYDPRGARFPEQYAGCRM